MATQEELQTGIGEEEAVTLKATDVTILEVNVEEVGEKKAKKVVCTVKHPDSKDAIKISSVKWETKAKLDVQGLWYNLDSTKRIRKGSALAVFMTKLSAKTLGDLVGKTTPTIQDEKGYLCFKAY